jgi:hypothetical protein
LALISDPSTLGTNGKDNRGRFSVGNKLGRGNPLAGRAAGIRAELLKMSTRDEIQEICRKLIEGAKAGDLAFIREWFDRTSGKPRQFIEMDLDADVNTEFFSLESIEAMRSLLDGAKPTEVPEIEGAAT